MYTFIPQRNSRKFDRKLTTGCYIRRKMKILSLSSMVVMEIWIVNNIFLYKVNPFFLYFVLNTTIQVWRMLMSKIVNNCNLKKSGALGVATLEKVAYLINLFWSVFHHTITWPLYILKWWQHRTEEILAQTSPLFCLPKPQTAMTDIYYSLFCLTSLVRMTSAPLAASHCEAVWCLLCRITEFPQVSHCLQPQCRSLYTSKQSYSRKWLQDRASNEKECFFFFLLWLYVWERTLALSKRWKSHYYPKTFCITMNLGTVV